MGIKVLKAGLLTTVQDAGRYGYRKDGIILAGAMDAHAWKLGNMLVGNTAGEAGIECTLMGPFLLFEQDQLIAITGADLSAEVDGVPVPMWRPIHIQKGAILSFGQARSGCRTYLAVHGGFDLPPVLGSNSTYLRAGFGGLEGRALKTGDLIPFKSAAPDLPGAFNWSLSPKMYQRRQDELIRVIRGPEFEDFHEKSMAAILTEKFKISKEADRMGYRLEGTALKLLKKKEMLSSAVAFGTVQVTAEGNPIVLMADHQTTGGYPRILQVASVDLGKLAQFQSGDLLSFELITLAQAQVLAVSEEQELRQLHQTLTFKYPING
ncbi:KipI antagonist [Pedobacter sp. KBW06]|uniref:5-oxoprolinase subunit C family protein n=1 Tax=Pedobacter sp. KBW06 TaxID=2153359 RepID=UPI000F5AFA22|nr:biotin-dependent carboxyltransferase family protein [Pedobacter sp. KBW06]RQO74876.1 KipI antagonist [Pedobacter sp. KBW06]